MAALFTESKQKVLPPHHNRGWLRLQFYDHPSYVENGADAYDGGKVKVWCKACFRKRVVDEEASDAQSGRPARERRQIELDCKFHVAYALLHIDRS